jgi:uncharacterized protein with HEPN domain
MAYDAILRNLAVIGEAVRALSSQTRARNRGRSMGCHRRPTQRAAIAGLRNVVVHEYFRINPELIPDIVENQLTPLKDQLQRQ